MNNTVQLSFKDILLYYDGPPSKIKSRKDPDISSKIVDDWTIKVPIVSAPMDSITQEEMAIALHRAGGIGIYTRLIGDPEENKKQIKAIQKLKKEGISPIACATGVKGDISKNAKSLCDAGLDIICVDIANGNHIFMKETLAILSQLKKHYSLSLIAGNVATPNAAEQLVEWGASALKIGIGAGASCSTRRVVGFGTPQLTAIMHCSERIKKIKSDTKIIADGGIRSSGDVIKAIWAGADTVMCGYILAGHDECPVFELNQINYPLFNEHNRPVLFGRRRIYRGMASRAVSRRDDIAAEGVSVEIKNNKGKVQNLISEYANAIRTACSMSNARNLNEFRENTKAHRTSTLTDVESEPLNEI